MSVFVLVGHCGPDSHMLRRTVLRAVSGARVESAESESEVERYATSGHVLLVNRELCGWEHSDGVELIREYSQRANAPVMLLVSNLEDWQKRAEEAGAKPGFGKAELEEAATLMRLRNAAETAADAAVR